MYISAKAIISSLSCSACDDQCIYCLFLIRGIWCVNPRRSESTCVFDALRMSSIAAEENMIDTPRWNVAAGERACGMRTRKKPGHVVLIPIDERLEGTCKIGR